MVDDDVDPGTNDGVKNKATADAPQTQTKPIPPDGHHPVDQGIKPHARHREHGNRDQASTITDKDRPLGQQSPAPVPGSPGYVEPNTGSGEAPQPVDAEDKND